jgi:hypothetical protein
MRAEVRLVRELLAVLDHHLRRLRPQVGEAPHQGRREHAVVERLHAVAWSGSASAAYASAVRISSRSRYGYSARISSIVMPAAGRPRTSFTVARIPRMVD